MNFSGATDWDISQKLSRRAVICAIIGLVLTLATIPAQNGFFPPQSLLWDVSIVVAIIGGFLWVVAMCLLSRSRGYHALWGLLLLFPPFIFIYSIVFPNKVIR